MDVIEDILTRLPVKHVLRCKLLSKPCYDLIKTPDFISRYSLRHRQSDRKIFIGPKASFDNKIFRLIWIVPNIFHEGGSEIFIPCPASHNFFTTVVGSCNGLLVVSYNDKDLIVCNPTTRDYKWVPEPELSDSEQMLRLNNHIHCNTAALGFAYDPQSGDYKLIKISAGYFSDGLICSYFIQVWNMSTNTWKQINLNPMPRLISEKEHVFSPYVGLLVDGILYWLAVGKQNSGRGRAILSFDPTNDTFGQIVLPQEVVAKNDGYRADLIDFKGSLALSISLISGDYNSRRLFDIWVMGSGFIWTKRFTIGLLPNDSRIAPVCVNGNFVLHRVLNRDCKLVENSDIILFDPYHNRVVKKDTVYVLRADSTAWSVTESLVSVGRTCEQ